MQTQVKICLVGGGGVGKSSIILRFAKGEFKDNYDPTISDRCRKQVQLEGTNYIDVELIDTAGQDEYSAIRERDIKECGCFILCFAINSRTSFIELHSILEGIRKMKGTTNLPCVVVGNKLDLTTKREVTQKEAEDFAKSLKSSYFEVSAQTGQNIDQCFQTSIRTFFRSSNNSNPKTTCCVLI